MRCRTLSDHTRKCILGNVMIGALIIPTCVIVSLVAYSTPETWHDHTNLTLLSRSP